MSAAEIVQSWGQLLLGAISVPLLIRVLLYTRTTRAVALENRRYLSNHLVHQIRAVDHKIDQLPCRAGSCQERPCKP